MKRNEEPIYLVDLKDPIDTRITFSDTFLKIRAWLRANGTPEDIMRVWRGEDDPLTTRVLTAFYLAESQVESHTRDAVDIETQRRRDAASVKKK